MHAIFPCRDHSPINPVNPITQFPESISPEYEKKKPNTKRHRKKNKGLTGLDLAVPVVWDLPIINPLIKTVSSPHSIFSQ